MNDFLSTEIIADHEQNFESNKSFIEEALSAEFWGVTYALEFLSGIRPDSKNTIKYQQEEHFGINVRKPTIVSAKLLTLNIPIEPSLFDGYELGIQVQLGQDTLEALQQGVLRTYKSEINRTEKTLDLLSTAWDSNPAHTRNQYPVTYFIEWATNQKIDIIWLTWTIRNGLLPTLEPAVLQEINKKEREDNLKIAFKPRPDNADQWCELIYEWHRLYPTMNKQETWREFSNGVTILLHGSKYTTKPSQKNIITIEEDRDAELSKRNFSERWSRYVLQD